MMKLMYKEISVDIRKEVQKKTVNYAIEKFCRGDSKMAATGRKQKACLLK
jgi:hypothetical protein